MAATCEISNAFSNYFSTMYSSGRPHSPPCAPAPTFGADDLVLALGSPQVALEGSGGSQERLGIWGLRAWDWEGRGRGGPVLGLGGYLPGVLARVPWSTTTPAPVRVGEPRNPCGCQRG